MTKKEKAHVKLMSLYRLNFPIWNFKGSKVMKTIIQWNCQAFSNINCLSKMLSISEAEFVQWLLTFNIIYATIHVHGLNLNIHSKMFPFLSQCITKYYKYTLHTPKTILLPSLIFCDSLICGGLFVWFVFNLEKNSKQGIVNRIITPNCSFCKETINFTHFDNH